MRTRQAEGLAACLRRSRRAMFHFSQPALAAGTVSTRPRGTFGLRVAYWTDRKANSVILSRLHSEQGAIK